MNFLIDHLPSRTIQINQQEYLYFSGTSYLGMGQNLTFREALVEGMARYGTSYGSSRNNQIQLSVYEAFEELLAHQTGFEKVLTCSSGLLTGQILVRFLEQHYAEAVFSYAPKTHPATWGSRFEAFGGNFSEWTKHILAHCSSSQQHLILICNSVDSFACQKQSFDFLKQLPQNQEITLIIDDSHGIGVLGDFAHKMGINSVLDIPSNIEVIVLASLNKALGIPAGGIFGRSAMIEKITQNPFWIGASPVVPAYAFAYLHTQDIYQKAHQQLIQNIAFVSKNLPKSSFDFLENYPVFISKETETYSKLVQNNIMPYHFVYPSQGSEAVTRLVISALHTAADLQKLVDILV
jgi:8-amino-7-oxononanoate synthase